MRVPFSPPLFGGALGIVPLPQSSSHLLCCAILSGNTTEVPQPNTILCLHNLELALVQELIHDRN